MINKLFEQSNNIRPPSLAEITIARLDHLQLLLLPPQRGAQQCARFVPSGLAALRLGHVCRFKNLARPVSRIRFKNLS